MIKVFYHSADLDGICSAAVVLHFISGPNYELFPINYNDEFPWSRIKPDDTVYMVDFSLNMKDMKRLDVACNKLIWIDHHKTAIEARDKAGMADKLSGIQRIGDAGCELTWEYLFPDDSMPHAVRLLGRYDVWDHKDPDVLPFQYGMRFLDVDPTSKWWWHLFRDDPETLQQLLQTGDTLLRYERDQNERYARAMSFNLVWEDKKFLACNKGFSNSTLFDSVLKPGYHDAVLLFSRGKKEWKISMYTHREEVDVGAIAKKYGGGGHQKAAGFYCRELPFELPTA